MASRRKTPEHRSLSIAIAAALGTVGPVVFSSGAFAQEPDQAATPPDDLEEVVVTGSRIQRRDYTSNSPIVTVEQDAFEAQVGLNFEAYLNQLPNYNPAAAPTTTQGDVQITPVNSVGLASATCSKRSRGSGQVVTVWPRTIAM